MIRLPFGFGDILLHLGGNKTPFRAIGYVTVHPEPVEGRPFMVRQTHHERLSYMYPYFRHDALLKWVRCDPRDT